MKTKRGCSTDNFGVDDWHAAVTSPMGSRRLGGPRAGTNGSVTNSRRLAIFYSRINALPVNFENPNITDTKSPLEHYRRVQLLVPLLHLTNFKHKWKYRDIGRIYFLHWCHRNRTYRGVHRSTYVEMFSLCVSVIEIVSQHPVIN